MGHGGESEKLSGDALFWASIGCIFLVAGAGFFVGIQVALFSIDRLFLRVLTTTGTPKEQKQAASLLGVLKLQHWTLVALVLMNATFCMVLPILLARMCDEITALIISITAVVFVGEVIPLAVFVRWAIPVCSFCTPAIWLAIVVTAPVSYPVGKLLDRTLGHTEEALNREDLAALIIGPQAGGAGEEGGEMLEATALQTDASGSGSVAVNALASREDAAYQLRESEVKMLQAAMLLSTDTVKEHLRTTAEKAFMLSSHDSLNRATILSILAAGFSRIPVYFGGDKKHIIGALIVNSLVPLSFVNPDPPPLVSDYPLREVIRLEESASLYDAYIAFRNGVSSMAAIYDAAGIFVGILTLNDVLATLYDADPAKPVALSGQYMRRQHKMVELVEGMKYLNATKRAGPASIATGRVKTAEVNFQQEAPEDATNRSTATLTKVGANDSPAVPPMPTPKGDAAPPPLSAFEVLRSFPTLSQPSPGAAPRNSFGSLPDSSP